MLIEKKANINKQDNQNAVMDMGIGETYLLFVGSKVGTSTMERSVWIH